MKFKKSMLVSILLSLAASSQAEVIIVTSTTAEVGVFISDSNGDFSQSANVVATSFDDLPIEAEINNGVIDTNAPGFVRGRAASGANGAFDVTTSGFGTFEALSTVSQTYTLTNDDVARNVAFDFLIEPGSIIAECLDGVIDNDGDRPIVALNAQQPAEQQSNCGPGSFAYADYTANILLNGVSIFNSFASVSTGFLDPNKPGLVTDPTTTTLGTVLSPGNIIANSSNYSWDIFEKTIDLGVLDPNEVFEIEYRVKSTARARVNDPFFFFIESGAGAGSFFSDPTGFTFTAQPVTTNNVSAPGSLLLGLLSVVAIFASRRK